MMEARNKSKMISRVRTFILGVFVGVIVARPILLAASSETYMVDTGFDPPVQTVSSSSSSSAGTIAAETTTAAAANDPSRTQLRAETNMSTNTNTSSNVIRDFEPQLGVGKTIHFFFANRICFRDESI
jgi:hypothetical protein